MGDASIPDVYSDQFHMATTTWGGGLHFGAYPVAWPQEQGPKAETKAITRMSHQHAKIVAMTIHKQLKRWEREHGEVPIPAHVFEKLELSPEAW